METNELLNKIQEMLKNKTENREKRKRNGDYFNIFELGGIAGKENIYSNIIANLLDPSWKHGQGNIFLKKFCDRLGLEFASSGETTVTREEIIPGRRPDIIIRNGNNLIVIENKTGTCDHEGQLQDYWDWMMQDGHKKNFPNSTLIYLTKYGEHPKFKFEIQNVYSYQYAEKCNNVSSCTTFGKEGEKFILLPYSEIRDWCAYCAITPGIPGCIADAFKQYANFIELWLKNEIDDSDIIAIGSKKENLDAIQEIYSNTDSNEENKVARQWVKSNYAQIIKAYIASKFPGKEWKGEILEIFRINDVFRVSIEYTGKNLQMGVTQTNDMPKKKMPYKRDTLMSTLLPEISKFLSYKSGASENKDHDCWWILYKEATNISKDNICDIIKVAQDLAANCSNLCKCIEKIEVYDD